MSWANEVQSGDSEQWIGNLLRFDTEGEAFENVRTLRSKWPKVKAIRVIHTAEPVNATWRNGHLIRMAMPRSVDKYRDAARIGSIDDAPEDKLQG